MTLTELQEKRGRLVAQAREALDEIKSNTDESRAQELDERHDKIMADFDKLESDIHREAKMKEIEDRMENAPDPRRPSSQAEGRGVDEGEQIDYRTAFHAYMRAQGNLGAMSSEERAILESGYSSLPAEERAQTTTNAAGGFSIPEMMLERVIESMKAWGPMYEGGPFSDLQTAGGNAMPMPTVDDTSVTAVSHTEGATLTDDGGKDVTFGQKQLDAYAFNTEWIRISKELADDSFIAMETFVGRLLGQRLARIANAKLTTGSGSSDVHGIVNASSEGKVAAANNAFTYDEILDFEYSVDPAYRNGNPASVGYMMHDKTALAIRKLKDGDGNYLWQEGNVRIGIPSTINGRPYWINQDMAQLTDGVDSRVMLFGDMSAYFVRKVGGAPLIGAIQDKDFWPGFGIAGYIRFDGELSDTAAVKHLALAAT